MTWPGDARPRIGGHQEGGAGEKAGSGRGRGQCSAAGQEEGGAALPGRRSAVRRCRDGSEQGARPRNAPAHQHTHIPCPAGCSYSDPDSLADALIEAGCKEVERADVAQHGRLERGSAGSEAQVWRAVDAERKPVPVEGRHAAARLRKVPSAAGPRCSL